MNPESLRPFRLGMRRLPLLTLLAASLVLGACEGPKPKCSISAVGDPPGPNDCVIHREPAASAASK
jgi:hypothetical protein